MEQKILLLSTKTSPGQFMSVQSVLQTEIDVNDKNI